MDCGHRLLYRKEAVALLKELGDKELVQPLMVIIQQRPPDRYQLKIKCDFYQPEIEEFLKKRGFSYETKEDYLIIYRP
jgi:hypothetical protein